MHTTEIMHEETLWVMHHNGDYSGDVIFDGNSADEHLFVEIPFAVVAELVGRAIISNKIENLEEQSGLQFLGLE